VVNAADTASVGKVKLDGVSKVKANARAFVLAGDDMKAVNSLDDPKRLVPVETTLKVAGPQFEHTFPPRSLSVLRVPVQ
jgi:alpha-L-arabinofuranosidase